jgi:hypothetical protein
VHRSSTCVTSILRTYYTWKTIKYADASYNVIIMGHWAWAEVSTGIVISCLPVFPKFVQHFGGKIYHCCCPKAGSKLALRSLPVDSKSKKGYSSGISIQDTWNGSLAQKSEHKVDFVKLRGFNMAPMKADVESQVSEDLTER